MLNMLDLASETTSPNTEPSCTRDTAWLMYAIVASGSTTSNWRMVWVEVEVGGSKSYKGVQGAFPAPCPTHRK